MKQHLWIFFHISACEFSSSHSAINETDLQQDKKFLFAIKNEIFLYIIKRAKIRDVANGEIDVSEALMGWAYNSPTNDIKIILLCEVTK